MIVKMAVFDNNSYSENRITAVLRDLNCYSIEIATIIIFSIANITIVIVKVVIIITIIIITINNNNNNNNNNTGSFGVIFSYCKRPDTRPFMSETAKNILHVNGFLSITKIR